jgi:hypothetical protein
MEKIDFCLGCEVLTALVMTSFMSGTFTLCSILKVNQCNGGARLLRLHLGSLLHSSHWFLAWLTLQP